MKNKVGLILAGGQSKRLFPIETPKPLLKVRGRFLLSEAIDRLRGFDVYIISNAQIAEQIKTAFAAETLPVPNFIIESEGRDTAAAVGFGLRSIRDCNPDWVAVLSADQWMKETEKFSFFMKTVEAEVEKFPNALFVCGSSKSSKNSAAHSQFGWIVPEMRGRDKSAKVKLFVEKPEGARLAKVRSAGGLINAGMFFGRYRTFLDAYADLYPEVLDAKFPYSKLPRQPIDRAIFEKFNEVRVFSLPLRWEDLGTWQDWFDLVGKGQGSGGVQIRSKNVLISSDDKVQVFSFSNEDLAIIQSGNRVLVMPLSKSKDLKKYLETLS